MSVKAYAAQSAGSAVGAWSIERREPTSKDVEIEIMYCGVCHTDVHFVRNEWGVSEYPMVPGHEILGRVTRVGDGVSCFKEGDIASVGCMVDSCRVCASCLAHEEQFCEKGPVLTYNSPDVHLGGMTYGGYSERIVVDVDFVLHVPGTLDPARAAPLPCAGITTYSPLKRWGAGKGKRVGIVGLGGLGHMAVKFAHSFGAETSLFTRSEGKAEDAKRLGADEVVISTDPAQMERQAGSFDLILDTVSADHDLNEYLNLLKLDGAMVMVGHPARAQALDVSELLSPRRVMGGSTTGGLRETQEMLDYCGEHGVQCDIEMIRMDQINEAYERIVRGDVKYRFVIDMKTLG